MPSRLAIALAVLTCLAWSPIDASDVDAVVPENMADNSLSAISTHTPPLNLMATSTLAIKNEIQKMQQQAPSDAGVTEIDALVETMTKALAEPESSHTCTANNAADQATCSSKTTKADCDSVVDVQNQKMCTFKSDGGSQDITDLVTNAKTAIDQAVNTMLSGLVTAYDNAKSDLKKLDDAIDNQKKTISASDLEDIKTLALAWCTKKRALETATTDATNADTALTTKQDEALGLSNILIKEVAGFGDTDCSHANTPKGGTCPTRTCNLAARIAQKVDTARTEYLALSWDKKEKAAVKTTATTAESASQTAFQTAVTTKATAYHNMCSNDDGLHGTAINLFNNNNNGRATMYHSLSVVKCHINHMEAAQSFNLPDNLLKTGKQNPTTSASDCVSKLVSVSDLETSLFKSASGPQDTNKSCPGLAAYEKDIRDYNNFGFDKDTTDWDASQTKCQVVKDHGGSSGANQGLAGFTYGNPRETRKNGFYGGCLHGIGGNTAAPKSDQMSEEDCANRCLANNFTGGNNNVGRYDKPLHCDAFEVYIPDYVSGAQDNKGHCHLQNFQDNKKYCNHDHAGNLLWQGGDSNYYWERKT